MTTLAPAHPRDTLALVTTPTLAAAAAAYEQAAELREQLTAAERDYHHLVLSAHDEGASVQQIADAVGTSRAPIYKRINRARLGGDYGTRPVS